MKTTIRIADEKDFLEITRLFKTGYFGYNHETGLALQDKKVFVARQEEKIIGFCSIGVRRQKGQNRKKEGYIVRVEVTKQFQGIGIGKQLLEKAQSFFQEQKIKTVKLTVCKKLSGYFKKAGFSLSQDRGPHVQMAKAAIKRPKAR